MQQLLHVFALALLTFSLGSSAAPNYNTPEELCSILGDTAKNGQALTSINDVSMLNETKLSCIISPKSANEISTIVRWVNEWNTSNKKIHISIAGARHSQGGHIASKFGILLNMKHFKLVESPKSKNGMWTVKAQAGALWSDVHNVISQYKAHSFANKVQQSSTPFTVGGTLSVNAHGRSFSYGSVIHSVEKFTIVLPDGTITQASRTQNELLFKLAIGGYGLFGVILDATLELHENNYLKAENVSFDSPDKYISLLDERLKSTPKHVIERDELGSVQSETLSSIAYLFATLSLDSNGFMTKGTAYTYHQLPGVDSTGFVNPDPKPSILNLRALVTKLGFWMKRKGFFVSTAQKAQLNFLMSQDTRLKMLTPPIEPILAAANNKEPDLLQEYFIPSREMPEFLSFAKEVFSSNGVTLSNAALRFIPKTHDSSLLTYESVTEDQLALVLYFALKLNDKNITEAEVWTQALVEKSIELKGRYYLPYQQWPSIEQFKRSYPNYNVFKGNKLAVDPNEVFSNQFYQHYLK